MIFKECIKDLQSGKREKGGALKSGIPSLGAEHLNENGSFNLEFSKLKYISNEFFKEMKKGKVRKGDIILVKDGATTGKVSFVDDNFPFEDVAVNEHVFLIRPKEEYYNKYIFYLLYSEFGKRNILNDFRGATVGGISKEFVNFDVIIPKLEEQKEIVKKLDKLQQIIHIRKKQINGLEEIIKSQFIEMFGNINVNDKKWKEDILKNNLSVVGGYAFKSSEFQESGIPILRIGNINTGKFRPKDLMFWKEDTSLENYAIYPNDVLMSLTGTVGKEDYGNICIIGNDYPKYYLNQRNAKLSIKETLNKEYISYALRVPEIKRRLTGISRGVRQANISNKDIENLKIPIPPIDLQNQFANIVKQIDKQKFNIQKNLEQIQILQESLMNKYFN